MYSIYSLVNMGAPIAARVFTTFLVSRRNLFTVWSFFDWWRL